MEPSAPASQGGRCSRHSDHRRPGPGSGRAGADRAWAAAAPAAGVGARPVPGPQLLMAESQPAGVRLVFRTGPPRWSWTRSGRHELRGAGAAGLLLRPLRGRRADRADEPPAATWSRWTFHRGGRAGRGRPARPVRGLPDRDKVVEVWLPLERDHPTGRAAHRRAGRPGHADRPVWLHHGSSISQGSVARARARPGPRRRPAGRRRAGQPRPRRQRAARPVHRAHHAGHPGRPGQRQDRDQHRQPRPDAPPRVRPGRARLPRHDPGGPPGTPLLVVSPLLCPNHEETPGPGTFDVDALSEGDVRFRATATRPTWRPASSRCR